MAIRSVLLSATAILALAACGEAPSQPETAAALPMVNGDECVPIADGMYEMRDGRLMVSTTPPELAASNPAFWAQEIETGLKAAGIEWLGVTIRDQVAVVTGTAPDADAKAYGLSAGLAAIEGHPRAGVADLIIVDGISVEGGEQGLGVPLAALAGQLTTAESCKATFDATLSGRTIQFGNVRGEISPVSFPLVDALGGIAMLCRAFEMEIGVHSDTRGADDYNLRTSQERANAVRDYLVGKGLAEETLKAVGYGETQPIDSGSTAEAHARNRRTEIKVTPR